MSHLVRHNLLGAIVFGIAMTALAADRATPYPGNASWKPSTINGVRGQLAAWLDVRGTGAQERSQVDALWTGMATPIDAVDLLDRLAQSMAIVDPRAKELLTLCSQPKQSPHLPELKWLFEESTLPLERNNLSLYLARWMVHNYLFDEAIALLETLSADQVVDPASLLFYQAVVYQRMLKPSPGLEAIDRLLEDPIAIPQRYGSLAKLLKADLAQLEEDSLDHIARRMDDVRRRLDLGRAGPKTREVEDGVIKSLDKLIKELEDMQQQQQQQMSQGGGTIRSSRPATDSQRLKGTGPGHVANKPVGNSSGWGDLPPKEREQAMQQIGKEFPAHYRDMIEQYFRKLATEDEK